MNQLEFDGDLDFSKTKAIILKDFYVDVFLTDVLNSKKNAKLIYELKKMVQERDLRYTNGRQVNYHYWKSLG